MVGTFALWGFVFSTVDCTLTVARNKESILNSIISGGFTGALLASRGGLMSTMRNGLIGASILALIEISMLARVKMMIAMGRREAEREAKRRREMVQKKPDRDVGTSFG
eukprot:TRINITY_DN864_c0_g1_i1.p1 TRINITY_DN864_c0_g1~~TRINITY_DN864_c0_g1_i1.p1  ORF type:complete len:109 (-),score=40.03 TRINITY_DN864_c0_g1_i1:116-442(-)